MQGEKAKSPVDLPIPGVELLPKEERRVQTDGERDGYLIYKTVALYICFFSGLVTLFRERNNPCKAGVWLGGRAPPWPA